MARASAQRSSPTARKAAPAARPSKPVRPAPSPPIARTPAPAPYPPQVRLGGRPELQSAPTPLPIQASLLVSAPSDPAEREASSTAAQIVRMPPPGTASPVASVPRGTAQPTLCSRSAVSTDARTHASALVIQRQPAAAARPQVSPATDSQIRGSLAGGTPLSPAVRRFMEPRFGANFSRVRIHTDTKAAAFNARLQARAFTVGEHIFFGPGQFDPESGQGRELLAHELTHTIQQGAAPRTRPNAPVAQRSPVHAQRLGISDALDYFAERANVIPGFRMFTILLGVNPINMSRVDRSPGNILRALIEFLPGGALITQALDNHGVFDRVSGWVAQQLATLGMVGSSIRQAVSDFLDSLGWTDIFDLGGVWNRAKRIFTEPIDRILSFAGGLVSDILGFIKDAILRPLARLAEGTRGYDLLKAILGEDPVTGDPVPRTAETLIGGFMRLIGQEEIWQNIQQSRAIPRAWAWFQGALGELLGFVRQIPGLFVAAFESLTIADIILVPRAFAKIASVFGGFIGQFISWAGNTVWNLLQIIFEVVAPGAMPYLRRAAAAFRTILRNPIGFVGNLVRAGILGFRQCGIL